MSDPNFGGGLMMVLHVERDNFLSQNHVIRSHGGLQIHVDLHLVSEPKQLQQNRFHGIQAQRQRGRDQIPEGVEQSLIKQEVMAQECILTPGEVKTFIIKHPVWCRNNQQLQNPRSSAAGQRWTRTFSKIPWTWINGCKTWKTKINF